MWVSKSTLAGFVMLGIILVAGFLWVDYSLEMAQDDAFIIDALGRQRMLSQAMENSILSYAMARSSYQVVEGKVRTLDSYIDDVRRVYTSFVIPPAERAGLVHRFLGTENEMGILLIQPPLLALSTRLLAISQEYPWISCLPNRSIRTKFCQALRTWVTSSKN